MESNASDAHANVETVTDHPVRSVAPLKIRYGRTAIALIGVFALLTALISGALSVIGVASAATSVVAFLVFAASLVLLRTLAVRDRRRRLNSAFRDAMSSTTAPAASAATEPAVVRKPVTEVFDAAAGAAAEKKPAVKPLTAEDLRRAALQVAAKGAADAKLADTRTISESEKWEPVEVPKPGYVAAAKAAAAELKPLEVPAAPKSSGKTSIKADQAGMGAPAEQPMQTAPVVIAGGASAASAKTKQAHALTNLDNVLKRRRA